jgi:TPR repeat protein
MPSVSARLITCSKLATVLVLVLTTTACAPTVIVSDTTQWQKVHEMVSESPRRTYRTIAREAEKGNGFARLALAECYMTGELRIGDRLIRTCDKNLDAELEWGSKAYSALRLASRHRIDAYVAYGWMHHDGIYVASDRMAAVGIWNHASDRGSPEALYALAVVAREDGNFGRAWSLLQRALAGGAADTRNLLADDETAWGRLLAVRSARLAEAR